MFYQKKFKPKFSKHNAKRDPVKEKEKMKKYKQENKDYLAIKWHEYYEKNKTRLLEHQKIMREIKKGLINE